jgi:ABC-type antimicrobial peptide transport system permease subunit
MNIFPWGVVVILSCGLIFTIYVIYYILRMAYLEMKDEEKK